MIILAVLQNMWVKDPDRVREILTRTPEARRRMITYSLFAGCRTGRVLKQIFGDDCPRRFVWDEASREVAGDSKVVFPADLDHLRTLLVDVKPNIVLAFGRVASDALAQLVPGHDLLVGPHPTARQPDTLARLKLMADCLDNMLRNRAANGDHPNLNICIECGELVTKASRLCRREDCPSTSTDGRDGGHLNG